jgi:hypothetical protein
MYSVPKDSVPFPEQAILELPVADIPGRRLMHNPQVLPKPHQGAKTQSSCRLPLDNEYAPPSSARVKFSHMNGISLDIILMLLFSSVSLIQTVTLHPPSSLCKLPTCLPSPHGWVQQQTSFCLRVPFILQKLPCASRFLDKPTLLLFVGSYLDLVSTPSIGEEATRQCV